jgi:hypothetical protein
VLRYSKESYTQMFDALLSEELSFNPVGITEASIQSAIKRVLGITIKKGLINLYLDLRVDESLNVHFKIKDPGGDVIPITLIYGG